MASLNHIGIAVADAAGIERLRALFALLDLGVNHVEDVPDQGVRTHFLPLPGDTGSLELLEVVDPQGTVARFIEKRGPGVHHLSFLVGAGELDAVSTRLRAAGYRLVYEAARPGAHGMRVNFVHPASAAGLLIELMERG